MFTLTKLNVLWDKVKALEARPSGGSDLPEVTSEDAGEVLMVSDTGEWEADEIVGLLPDVDSSDNGKLLGVSEGEWGVVDAPSAGYDITSTEVDTGIKIGTNKLYAITLNPGTNIQANGSIVFDSSKNPIYGILTYANGGCPVPLYRNTSSGYICYGANPALTGVTYTSLIMYYTK